MASEEELCKEFEKRFGNSLPLKYFDMVLVSSLDARPMPEEMEGDGMSQ